jgi:hypothetical protein
MKKLLISLLLTIMPVLAYADTPEQVGFAIGGLTNSSGQPLAGGKIYTYACGTTSNKTTWQDGAKGSTHANPVVLDGEGKKLIFADGCYKFRIDNSADVTQYTLDNLRFGLYSGVGTYADSTTGSSNTYVATLTPALLALNNGASITFVANHTNTSTATLNVNGLGAISLTKHNAGTLSAGDIKSGTTYTAVYDTSANAWVLTPPTFDDMSTWTPAAVSSAGTGTYTTNNARCSKLGDIAYCSIYLSWSQATATHAQVTVNLPYTAKTKSGGQIWSGVYSEDAAAAIRTDGLIVIGSGASTATIRRSAALTVWPIAAGVTNIAVANFFYETE